MQAVSNSKRIRALQMLSIHAYCLSNCFITRGYLADQRPGYIYVENLLIKIKKTDFLMPGDSTPPWFKKAYPSPKIFLIFLFLSPKRKGVAALSMFIM